MLRIVTERRSGRDSFGLPSSLPQRDNGRSADLVLPFDTVRCPVSLVKGFPSRRTDFEQKASMLDIEEVRLPLVERTTGIPNEGGSKKHFWHKRRPPHLRRWQ